MFKNNQFGWRELSLLMLIAYIFSFTVRLIWVFQFQDNPSSIWNSELMINTNDGYFFASTVEYLLTGAHSDNPRIHIAIDSYPAFIYTTYFLTKFTPMSIETTILYMPSIISSFIVIPLILLGQLIRLPWVGFFSALLGSIVWSYYNRTMVGYYDTDMFSSLLLFTVLYLFLSTIYHKSIKNIIILLIVLLLTPLFYPQGVSLIYAMFILWTLYQLLFQRDNDNIYIGIIVVSIALWSLTIWIKIIIIGLVFLLFKKINYKLDNKRLIYILIITSILFLLFGNMFGLISNKIEGYLSRGVIFDGLHFYQVIQTVREAGSIPWETVANRVIGSPLLLVLSIMGYIILLFKYKKFIVALPLIGVGVFAHWAGLRFTVYAVPVASFTLIYLFYFISQQTKERVVGYSIFVIFSLLSLYPNITHIIAYKTPTVLKKQEVEDLVKLDKIASDKDYTLAWWDYGYPIWFYSDTSTLIDGAKHNNDNFIISQIMLSDSQTFVANFSRLAVEKYSAGAKSAEEYRDSGADRDSIPDEFKMYNKDGEAYHAGGGSVIDILLQNNQKEQRDPDIFLTQLESSDYKLPPKTRDIFLYFPYRMLSIFPTISLFGNLDLKTGKKMRDIIFYPTTLKSKTDSGILTLSNGIIFNLKSGLVQLGKSKQTLQYMIFTENSSNGDIKVQGQRYNSKSNLVMIFMKSYNKFILLDTKTFNSAFVQMFILGKYDKNLFDLVVASPYSRVYRVKK